MRNLVAGNWKMNGLRVAIDTLDTMADALPQESCEVLICPPATLIAQASARVGKRIAIGAQCAHHNVKGAHTGDLSAQMLHDAGARYVILGHSERRADHGESDALIAMQCTAALDAGLHAIICVGESRAARDDGQAQHVVGAQLTGSIPDHADPAHLVIAYEPVWAIGTGLVPAIADIDAMHHFIRQRLVDRFGHSGGDIRILYGGSMNATNAADIATVTHVNGGLVGGASLRAADFLPIVAAFSE